MFNLFKYSYKLVPTGKPDTVYLVPTASTWAKAFAPSLIIMLGGAAVYGYAAYVGMKEEAERQAAEPTVPDYWE
jgi:hypothetical protein